MRQLLIALLFFLSTISHAQNRVFMGRVTDRQNHPVPFAVIEAKGLGTGVYTDEQGVFAFWGDAMRIQTLVVSCLGFATKEINTDILPADSVMIILEPKATKLKEVTITGRNGKELTGILGKSRKKLHADGDCYRMYGSETAIRLDGDRSRDGILESVYVYITGEGDPKTKFRIHVYEYGDKPNNEITDSNVIVQARKGNTWVKVDLSAKRIPVNEGLFISVEWVSGYGNSQQVLQSEKNPEVDKYNGQVLGITDGYGKPSYTWSRKPFSKDWSYYDAADAQRKGGYFLNPMIMATYTYVKQ